MKNKFLLALIVPVAAFIISCGPTDMQNDGDLYTNDLSAEIVDQNIDGVDNLNLTEEAKSDYWLAYYIPSSYYYYSYPYFWGSYYPYYGSFYYPYYYGWHF